MFNCYLRPCIFPLLLILLLVATSEERCLMNHSLCSRKNKRSDSNKGKIHDYAFVDMKKAGNFLQRAKDAKPAMSAIFNVNAKRIKESGSASGRQKSNLNSDKEQQSGGSSVSSASSANGTEPISRRIKRKLLKEILTPEKSLNRMRKNPAKHHTSRDIKNNKHYHSPFHRYLKRASSVNKALQSHLNKLADEKLTKTLSLSKLKWNGKDMLKQRSNIRRDCKRSGNNSGFNIACNTKTKLKPRKAVMRNTKNSIISRVPASKDNSQKFPRNSTYKNSESSVIFTITFAVKYLNKNFKEPATTNVIYGGRSTTESLSDDLSLPRINLHESPVQVNMDNRKILDKRNSPGYALPQALFHPVSQTNMIDPLWVHRFNVGKEIKIQDDLVSSEDSYLNKYAPASSFANRNILTDFGQRNSNKRFYGIRTSFTTVVPNSFLSNMNTDEYFPEGFTARTVKYQQLPFPLTQQALGDLSAPNIENSESKIVSNNVNGNKLALVTPITFFARQTTFFVYPLKKDKHEKINPILQHKQQTRKRKEINYFQPDKKSQMKNRNKGKIIAKESKVHHEIRHFYKSLDTIPNILMSSGGRIIYKSKQENYVQSKIRINMPRKPLKYNNSLVDMLEIQQEIPKGKFVGNSKFFTSKYGYPTPHSNIEEYPGGLNTANESRIKKLLLSLKELLKNTKAKTHKPQKVTNASLKVPVLKNKITPITVLKNKQFSKNRLFPAVYSKKPNLKKPILKSKVTTSKSKIATFFTEITSTLNDSHGTIPNNYKKIVRLTVQKTVETPDTRSVASLIVGILGFILIVFITVTVYLVALKYQDRLKLLKSSLRLNKKESEERLPGLPEVLERDENEKELYERIMDDNRQIKLLLNQIMGELKFCSDAYLSELYSTRQHQKKIRNATSGIIK